ncbi:hypothetical protein OH786_11665 [Streptomyces atratus]|uniref:Uncharacterized protein n=1 Tax=Streptomyces atratus TaxID=1893 RepID=A0A1K2F8B0_STRAR|nr:hypothetical protein [Streptomyces atratus]SFY43468.1 hypothetical protein SAMN02787144_103640 [Streptomyces atratus]
MADRLRDLTKAAPNPGVLRRRRPFPALYGAQAELGEFAAIAEALGGEVPADAEPE